MMEGLAWTGAPEITIMESPCGNTVDLQRPYFVQLTFKFNTGIYNKL